MGRVLNWSAVCCFSLPSQVSFALLVLAGVLVTGCGLIEPEKAPPACPELIVLKEAKEMTRFEGNGRDLTDVSFEADINNFVSGCILDEETNNLENQVVVRFELTQGPASKGVAEFRYFVAVATLDRKILTRESFGLSTPFEGNQTSLAVVDNIFPTIPLRDGKTGEDYIIFVGFELSRSELYYNRTKL